MKTRLFKRTAIILMAIMVLFASIVFPTVKNVFAEEMPETTQVELIETEALQNEAPAQIEEKISVAIPEQQEEVKAEAQNIIAEQKVEEVKAEAQNIVAEQKVEDVKAEAQNIVAEQKADEVKAEAQNVVAEQKEEAAADTSKTTESTNNVAAVEETKEEAAQDPVAIADHLTVHVTNIVNAAGPYEKTLTMTWNQSKLITGFYSHVGGKNKTASTADCSYTFLNAFVLSTGSIVGTSGTADGFKTLYKIQCVGEGKVVLHYNDGTTQTLETTNDIYISPVYYAKQKWHLSFQYIDRISTGSGSWAGSASSYTHTFKDPSVATSVAHYNFLYWEDAATGARYTAGQKAKYSEAAGSPTNVTIYAYWQPTVTVNYYDFDGSLLDSKEAASDIAIYDAYKAAEIEGAAFIGWQDGNGELLAAEAKADIPAITVDPVEQKIVKVYARYSTSYTVKHFLENAEDEEYTEAEDAQEVVSDVLAGSMTEAQAKEFEGFTAQEITQESVAVDGSTVIAIYYSRNEYQVTYSYTGEVPEKASELPEAAMVKFGAEVEIAKDATAEGYTFSGWDRAENFTMPAEDIEITGSFEKVPEKKADKEVEKAIASAVTVIPQGPANGNPTGTPTNPTNTPAAGPNNNTPAQNIKMEEIVMPKAAPQAAVQKTWALMNLILSIAAALIAAVMIITFLMGKKEGNEEDEEKRNRNGLKFLGLIPVAAAIILFILTQDMNNEMALTDNWTILTALFAALTLGLGLVIRNKGNKEDKKEANAI